MGNSLCQSCGMPLGENEDLFGTNQDGGKNKEYCLYCYKDGHFTAEISMEEMIAFCAKHVVSAHPEMTEDEAKTMMKKMFPMLRRWQSNVTKKVFCPKSYYIALEGKGNPGEGDNYGNSLNTLYELFFVIQASYQKEGKFFFDCPPHTLWWAESDKAADKEKEEWSWCSMVEVPGYINEQDLISAKMVVQAANRELAKAARLYEMNECTAFEVLYTGSYEGEAEKARELRAFIEKSGYQVRGKHHSIYLDDPKDTPVEKLRTIIRYSAVNNMEEPLNFMEEAATLFHKLGETNTMVLATSDGARVSARNMSVIIQEGKFYFQTALEFQKCEEMKKNSHVALCVDNIQIEGMVTGVYAWYDEPMADFRKLYQQHHHGSYQAYSKLVDNRIFEITPEKAKQYCYKENDVLIKHIDFMKKNAGMYWYLVK